MRRGRGSGDQGHWDGPRWRSRGWAFRPRPSVIPISPDNDDKVEPLLILERVGGARAGCSEAGASGWARDGGVGSGRGQFVCAVAHRAGQSESVRTRRGECQHHKTHQNLSSTRTLRLHSTGATGKGGERRPQKARPGPAPKTNAASPAHRFPPFCRVLERERLQMHTFTPLLSPFLPARRSLNERLPSMPGTELSELIEVGPKEHRIAFSLQAGQQQHLQ